jgi:hypothetical protein
VELCSLFDVTDLPITPQGLFSTEVTLDPSIMDRIDKLTEAFGSMETNIKVEHSVPQFEYAKHAFSNWVADNNIKAIALGGSLLASVVAYKVTKKNLFLVASTAIASYAAFEYATELKDLISAYNTSDFDSDPHSANMSFFDEDEFPQEAMPQFKGDNSILPEAGAEYSGIVNAFISLVYLKSLGTAIDKKSLTSFLRTIGEMPKLGAGIKYAVNWVCNLVQMLLDFITNRLDLEPVILNGTNTEVRDYCNEVTELLHKFNTKNILNAVDAAYIYELQKRGNKLLNSISADDRGVRDVITNCTRTLAPVIGCLRRANLTRETARIPPFAIMIGGPPGVGKTRSSMPLLLSIICATIDDDQLDTFMANPTNYIYTRCPEQVFWDSYTNQFAVFYDEFGQEVDVAGSGATSYMEVLRGINHASFGLHVAHLEDKGVSMFTSQLIMAVTNTSRFAGTVKSIHHVEALTRRWNMPYVLVPKLKYCKPGEHNSIWDRRLDLTTVVDDTELDTDVHEFHPWDFLNGRPLAGPILSFDDFLRTCITKFRSNKKKNLGQNEANGSAIQKALRFRLNPEMGQEAFAELWARACGVTTEFIMKRFVEYDIRDYRSLQARWDEFYKSMMYDEIPEMQKAWSLYIQLGRTVYNTMKLNPTVTTLIYIVPLAIVCFKYYGSSASEWDNVASQGESGVSATTRRQNRVKDRFNRDFNFSRADMRTKPQGGAPNNLVEFAESILKRSSYIIKPTRKSNPLGTVTFIKGSVGFMPMHFAELFENLDEQGVYDSEFIELSPFGAQTISIYCKPSDFKYLRMVYNDEHDDDSVVNDIVYFEFLKKIRPHQNITSHFISARDPIFTSTGWKIVIARSRPGSVVIMDSKCRLDEKQTYHNKDKSRKFGSVRTLVYNVDTKTGDCGSLLYYLPNNLTKIVILGFHMAGNDKDISLGYNVTLEEIEKAIEHFSFQISEDIHIVPEGCVSFNTVTLPYSYAKAVPSNNKTKVIMSPLYESWSRAETAPAVLRTVMRDGMPVNPLALVRRKYSRSDPIINHEILTSVTNQYISSIHYNAHAEQPWEPRVLTYKEAVEGVPGVAFCESLPRKTGAGYPYCLKRKLPGKKDFFGSYGDFTFTSTSAHLLAEDVENLLTKAKLGIRTTIIYNDFLKDERRSFAKIEKVSTRMVSGAPLHYTIACRMYFLDVVRFTCTNRIYNGICIGMNPYSTDWDACYRFMTRFGDNCFAGDYSAYDASLPMVIMHKCLEVIESYYINATPEDRLVREVLFWDVVNSRHIAPRIDEYKPDPTRSGVVYEWLGSVPSGTFLTTWVNSVCNNIILRYCSVQCFLDSICIDIISAQPEHYVKMLDEYEENVSIITYGDDNGVAVSDTYSFINQNSISNAMVGLGLTYTDEVKTTIMTNFRRWVDCTFLKRGFLLDPTSKRVLAPLALATILEAPYWTRSDADPTAVQDTVQQMLFELALHPEHIFDKYAPLILEASKLKLTYFPTQITYRDCKAMALSQDALW